MSVDLDLDNISLLLNPFSDTVPTGQNLRLDIHPTSSYQLLRNERSSARNNERQALSNGEIYYFDQDDWQDTLEKTPKIIADESKDIELVAWFIEALTRFHGFKGLAYGFCLARQLIESFGQDLHPQPDEDGISTQMAPLTGLNGIGGDGALITPIKSIVMTQGESHSPQSSWQCEQIFDTERISDSDKREARFRQGTLSRDQLDRLVSETSDAFIHQLQDDIALAISEFDLYIAVVDEYTKEDPQPTGNIKRALASCQQVLTYIAGDRLKKEQASESDTGETSDALDETSVETPRQERASSPAMTVDLNSREQALKTLKQVADYFRKAEPHSPVSYTIEQAIRWSRMPLTELISELIPDDESRKKYQHLSGIPADENDS